MKKLIFLSLILTGAQALAQPQNIPVLHKGPQVWGNGGTPSATKPTAPQAAPDQNRAGVNPAANVQRYAYAMPGHPPSIEQQMQIEAGSRSAPK